MKFDGEEEDDDDDDDDDDAMDVSVLGAAATAPSRGGDKPRPRRATSGNDASISAMTHMRKPRRTCGPSLKRSTE